MVFNHDMAGQGGSICHDDVVAENTIVRHVYIDHQEIVIADLRMTAAALCAAIDVHIFAKHVMRTDRQECLLALVLEILWRKPDRCEGEEPVVIADGRRSFNNHMRFEVAPVADPDTVADPAEGADKNVRSEFGFRTDDGGGV